MGSGPQEANRRVNALSMLPTDDLAIICDALSELVDPYGWDDPDHEAEYALLSAAEEALRRAKAIGQHYELEHHRLQVKAVREMVHDDF